MDRILSEEEIHALLSLFQTGRSLEEGSAAGGSLASHDLQRRFFRLDHSLPVHLYINASHYQARATNIGLGGIFVCGALDFPIGQRLELELELPGPRALIRVVGFICWQKKVNGQVIGLGIRFSSLSTEAIWAIISNIEQFRKDTPPTQS